MTKRSGGYGYQWRIESRGSIDPNLHYRLCFKETEGSSQCQGTRSSCTGWTLTRLGQVLSVTTLMTGPAVVSTLGGSSRKTLPSRCAACASSKQKEALSVRKIAEAAADGAVLGIPPGPYLSVMTPMTVLGGVSISGSLTVCQKQIPYLVQRTVHARGSVVHPSSV